MSYSHIISRWRPALEAAYLQLMEGEYEYALSGTFGRGMLIASAFDKLTIIEWIHQLTQLSSYIDNESLSVAWGRYLSHLKIPVSKV